MRWRAAAANGAATTVEQRQRDIVSRARLYQGLLSLILCPPRCQHPRILGAVGVANHHHELFLNSGAIGGIFQQAIHHWRCVVQISQGLEQRDHLHSFRATR